MDLLTGETQRVASTKTKDGGLFGWLLQGASSGVFRVAAQVLHAGARVLDRISIVRDGGAG